MRRTLAEIIYDCLFLNGIPKDINNSFKSLIDKQISSLILIREYSIDYSLIFLYSSDCFYIPRSYFNLFQIIDIYEGEKLLKYIKILNDSELDTLDLFIKYFFLFYKKYQKMEYNNPTNDILLVYFENCCNYKTKEFRNFINKYFNENLYPWRYESLLGCTDL